MTFKLLATITLLLAPSASGFVLPKSQKKTAVHRSAVGDQDPMTNKGPGFDAQDLLSKVPEFDFKSLDLEVIKNNVMEGNVGERGEAYAAAQFALLLFIVGGGIPLVGDLMMLLLGPCLMLAGVAAFSLSIRDLGNSISPWIVPSEEGELVQEGIYAKLRHPQYAGLLAMLAGFSIVTGSASRLLLTALLFYVFSEMAAVEEDELMMKYSSYSDYKRQVPGKFFPDEIAQQLPWNQD